MNTNNQGFINVCFSDNDGCIYSLGRNISPEVFVKVCNLIDPGYARNFAKDSIFGSCQEKNIFPSCNAYKADKATNEAKEKICKIINLDDKLIQNAKERHKIIKERKQLLDSERLNSEPQSMAEQTSEQPKEDTYAECREQAFKLSDTMGNLLKGLGVPHSEEFVKRMKKAALDAETKLKEKENKAAQQPLGNPQSLNQSRMTALREKLMQFQQPQQQSDRQPQTESPAPKQKKPVITFGIIGGNISDEDVEMLKTLLGDNEIFKEDIFDKVLRQTQEHDEPEFKPMDCDHQCFSCKSLGTCETIKMAMQKTQDKPVQ